MKTARFIYLILFSLFASAAAGAAHLRGGDTVNFTDSAGKRQGYWIVFGSVQKNPAYRANQVVMKGHYTDNKKTGYWLEYYPNDSLKSSIEFRDNRPNGQANIYYENGKLKEAGTWKGTRWVGPYKLYYESGVLRQEFNYSGTGKREGFQRYYYPNGQLHLEKMMQDGKEEGWEKEYTETGCLKEERFYSAGMLNPSKTIRHDCPPVIRKKPDPVPPPEPIPPPDPRPPGGNGHYTLYNKQKQIDLKGVFKNWKLMDGEQYIYDPNGILIRIKAFKDGKYVGDKPLPAGN
ncbi:MAG: MORN variant repeat-containing protein [Bacteroidetes bacterium]|nr:MAG: MORN variant repeat-containing protein [Bacteroidota bacterium]